MTDVLGSTHGPGKNITLYYCVISRVEMIMMMMMMMIIIIIMIMVMMMMPKWKH